MNKKIIIGLFIIGGCIGLLTFNSIRFGESYQPQPFLLSYNTTNNDTGIIEIHSADNETTFPLFKRDGTPYGWIVDGNFTRENPFDIWIYVRWNDTHSYNPGGWRLG